MIKILILDQPRDPYSQLSGHPRQPDNLVRMIRITSKVALQMSEVLLKSQNLFKNSYMFLYIFPVFWLRLIHLNF